MIKSLAWVAASVFVGGGTVAAITVSHNAQFNKNSHPVVNAGPRTVNSPEGHPPLGVGAGPEGNIMAMLTQGVANALHISPAKVEQELNSGQNLNQIAQHAGSSASALKQALIQDAQAEIHKAVVAGLFTSSQANRLDSHLNAWFSQIMGQSPVQWQKLVAHQGAQVMMGMLVNDVSSALHISPTTVQKDMKSHKSLAQIANNAGSSASALETALLQDARSQIQKGVSVGVLTRAQANVLDAHMGVGIDHLVTQNPAQWQHSSRSWGKGVKGIMGILLEKTAQSLHMSVGTLRADLHSGQTPAQMATHAGSSPKALEATLLSDAKTRLLNVKSMGLMNSAQTSRLESHMSVMINQWVTGGWSHKASISFGMHGTAGA